MTLFNIPLSGARSRHTLSASDCKLFIFLVVFRLLNALIQKTAFVPDEFWQSIEVAHHWVFGYGSLTWEWHPKVALRSPLHPMLIALLYWLSKLTRIDSAPFVLLAPRMLHAFIAAVADLHLYRLSLNLAGAETAKWVLFHQIANWFTSFCSPRPLANSLEWVLTTVALANYPVWSVLQKRPNLLIPCVRQFVFLALGCVIIRPTAAVIWGPLCIGHLLLAYTQSSGSEESEKNRMHLKPRNLKLHGFRDVCAAYFTWGIFWLICSILVDRWAYGRWTINQWNFLRFNLLSSGSHIYGVHSWHWYLSQGLPAMLLIQIPFVFLGIYSDWPTHRRLEHRIPCRILTILFVWTTFCYSLLGHKEFRFLFPLLPVAIYLCGRGTTFLFSRFQQHPRRNLVSYVLILGVLATQVPVLLYTSLVHQRGTLDAMEFVGRFVENQQYHRVQLDLSTRTEMWMSDPSSWHVLCLMPCHSVPSVGFLHKNITLRHLNCDPDLSRWFGESDSLMDEVDRFYAHPVAWLASEIQITNPHVILLFDHLFKTVPQVEHLLLIGLKYRVCGRFFHAHLLTHSRHGHYVLALCRSDLDN